MGDFHLNRAFNKGVRLKLRKKHNFLRTENFYSIHSFNMGFHAIYTAIVTLQRNRALFYTSISRILENKLVFVIDNY